jgi:competence protein ComEC
MLILVVIALSTTIMFQRSLLPWLYLLSQPFHQVCLAAAPIGRHNSLYQALVCGASFEDPGLQQDFARTGLLHVIVVSGSHLVFLERILTKALPYSSAINSKSARTTLGVLLALFAFVLAAGAEPPVLRAYFQMSLYLLNHHRRLNWRISQITLLSGASTLIFCGDEPAIRSLALSWTASLALNTFANPYRESLRRDTSWGERVRRSFWLNLKMYLLLAPALLLFALPHPASILCNWLLAPVLGEWLFPASLAAFFWTKLAAITDVFWNLSLVVLQWTALFTPDGWKIESRSTPLLLGYLLLLSGVALVMDLSAGKIPPKPVRRVE